MAENFDATKSMRADVEQFYHMMIVKELLHRYGSSFFSVFVYARSLSEHERDTYFHECRRFLQHLEEALKY